MVGDKDATATVDGRDLPTARKFYEGVLGLQHISGNSGGIVYRSGSSSVLVYTSQFAGTNKATAISWVVGDALEGLVRSLKAKGISFEHYELPETRREG